MAGIGQTKMIEIVRVTAAKDADHNNVETASLLYAGWAEVTEVSGTRRFQDLPLSLKTYLFKIRFRPLITPVITDTVVYGGRRYTVQDVTKSDEKKFTYEIIAQGSGATSASAGLGDFIIEEDGDTLITEDSNSLIVE